jgi:hypothetical protein
VKSKELTLGCQRAVVVAVETPSQTAIESDERETQRGRGKNHLANTIGVAGNLQWH